MCERRKKSLRSRHYLVYYIYSTLHISHAAQGLPGAIAV